MTDNPEEGLPCNNAEVRNNFDNDTSSSKPDVKISPVINFDKLKELRETKEYNRNKKDFIQLDYKVIKDEILQLKNGQIMIITAATSVTGVLLSFLINSYSQTPLPNYFMEMIFFLPLLIILPSFAICIHKSTLINIKSGYLNCLGFYLAGYEKIQKYFGYGNYSEEWYKKYESISIDENNKLEINSVLFYNPNILDPDKTNKAIFGIKLFWGIIVQFFKNSISLLKFNQKYRYWSLIVTVFFGLILVCYFFPFIHILQNKGNLLFLLNYWQFGYYLIIAFFTMAIYSIGKVMQLRNLFWYLVYFFQSSIFIYLFYSLTNLDPNTMLAFYLSSLIVVFFAVYAVNHYNIHISKKKKTSDYEKDLKTVKKWVFLIIMFDIIISIYDLSRIEINGTGLGFLTLLYIISFIVMSVFLWGFATIYNMSYGKARVDIIEKIWNEIINGKNNDYPEIEEEDSSG